MALQDELFRHCPPALASQLHVDDDASVLVWGPWLEAYDDAFAVFLEAPFGFLDGAVAGFLPVDFLGQAGEAEDGGGEVVQDGEGVRFVLVA